MIVRPYHGMEPACRVLVLVSAAGGNVPTRSVLDETRFATVTLVVEAFAPDQPLPPHDVVFNAIGDADRCQAALRAAERLAAGTDARVINPPSRAAATGRAHNARSLSGLPHIRAPRIIETDRAGAAAAAAAIGYPLLVRSPGFHTGLHFRKVDGPQAIAEACAALPTERVLLIEFLDTRDARGRARKYRVMTIAGVLYPLHLAISDDWKVHYFTADMAADAAHRAEEQAFLDGMAGVLSAKAMMALEAISKCLGLDYAGIDFSLAADGSLVLFEANATMAVNPPGPEPIWNYRRPHVDKILAAAQAMVLKRE